MSKRRRYRQPLLRLLLRRARRSEELAQIVAALGESFRMVVETLMGRR